MSAVNARTELTTPETFSRKATGLVRVASLRDVFAFNVGMQNIFIGVIFSLLLIPPLYPKANIYLATLFALVAAIPVSWVYAKLSGAYPRSGGDYVFVSRIIHPAVGFMSNLSYCVWGAFYIGVAGVFLGIYGLAPLFRVLGSYTESQSLADAGNWFAGETGEFVMAVGLIALFVTIFIFGGMRLYFRIQAVNFSVAMIALAFLVIWGFIASRGGAFDNLDTQIGHIGGETLAPLAGGGKDAGFSLKDTIFASIWPWLAFNSAIYSTYMGGEVKRADRTQPLGIVGSLLWAGAWSLLALWAMISLFGETFWANLGNANPEKFGLSSTPTFGEVSGYALGNAVVATIMMVGLALWTYVWVAPYAVLLTRSMLAWSLDRIGPPQLAEVDQRWHSPRNALLVILVLGIVTSAFYAFGNLSVLTGTIGITGSMIIVAIAGAVFPYRRRELWRASPAAGTIAGIPTITLVSLVAIVPLGLIEWALIADINSGASLEADPKIFWTVLGVFVVGFPLYYVIRAVQRARNVNVDLAYREIPPE